MNKLEGNQTSKSGLTWPRTKKSINFYEYKLATKGIWPPKKTYPYIKPSLCMPIQMSS